MNAILYGLNDGLKVQNKSIGVNIDYVISFEGICNFISEQYHNNDSIRLKGGQTIISKKFYVKLAKDQDLKKKLYNLK